MSPSNQIIHHHEASKVVIRAPLTESRMIGNDTASHKGGREFPQIVEYGRYFCLYTHHIPAGTSLTHQRIKKGKEMSCGKRAMGTRHRFLDTGIIVHTLSKDASIQSFLLQTLLGCAFSKKL